ncbi:hypothetical protein FB451DRAFT_1182747 [Mycena latifolia]|nr:hypothetical protein FB451DRAFT_1182747 [Mycena latifolia]
MTRFPERDVMRGWSETIFVSPPTMDTVFRIQELCGHIAEYLCESSTDLESCALVSRTLTSSAQRHLFRDIVLHWHGKGLPSDGVYYPKYVNEEARCVRLCAILKASPHLLPLVRRLRASLEAAVVGPLSKMKFPHLNEVVLDRSGFLSHTADKDSVAGTAALLRLPFSSIPHLECLRGVTVVSYAGDEPLPLPPRAPLKTLRFYGDPNTKWLLDPLFPFDCSTLESLECGMEFLDSCDASILRESWSTITQLKLFHSHEYHARLYLASFPELTYLEVISSCYSLPSLERLLASLGPENRVKCLRLNLHYFHSAYDWQNREQIELMHSFGAALASVSLPALRRIQVRVVPGHGMPTQARDAFAEFDKRGLLDVGVIEGMLISRGLFPFFV